MSPSDQQSLFETEAERWELDDQNQQLIARVVFPAVLDQTYDYRIPDALAGEVEPGRRVRVPLGHGNQTRLAYCVEVDTQPATRRKLKDVASVVDKRRLLSPSMLRLTRWMSERYLCSWGEVLEGVLPAAVRDHAGTRVAELLSVPPEVIERLNELQLPAKQKAALEALAASPEPLTATDLARVAGCTTAPIKALKEKGLVQLQRERIHTRVVQEAEALRESHLTMHADQQKALSAIVSALDEGRHETIVLHGVTGSGKTEVYIQAIQHVLSFGRQAIVLVPEISLTPQTKQRFRARFGNVAVLHSHLSDVERHWHWEQIAKGEVSVVVGARSAVFAPTPHLGLIVLDEEHESSFKQSTVPRYHAREVALQRAKAENIPLVLGSATPSLETWHRAQQGEYRLVEMPDRVFSRPLPDVETIDLRVEFLDRRQRGALSRPLVRAMEETLNRGEQVILLLNRRGYSTHIQCPACGETVRCPNCDITLTHHRVEELAVCHYCDYRIDAPQQCPACQFAGIRYSGLGTQRLEHEVQTRFPHHACLRMDTDAMQKPGSHERALAAFRAGEVQILLGTQMIAKGLDFPNVTLVGVVQADTALHLPDFRAAERTFQLLVQVAGRTGRGDKGGRVLVQTFSPEHPVIQAAIRHDYHSFAQGELPNREMLGYPPYSEMVRLVVRGPSEAQTEGFAQLIAQRLRSAILEIEPCRVLGPAPCPITRLRGLYRFQVQAQSPHGAELRAAVAKAVSDVKPPEGVQWIVDVDPLEML